MVLRIFIGDYSRAWDSNLESSSYITSCKEHTEPNTGRFARRVADFVPFVRLNQKRVSF